MPSPLKVMAVSGSRADWNLLSIPLAVMRDDPHFDVHVVITGQHLLGGTDATEHVIASDGFRSLSRIDMQLIDDAPVALTRSLGHLLGGIAGILADVRPDLMFVLGDRYEILGAVTAALMFGVPVAHLCGGDITEGAMDDAIRHSITKMSHIHFVTNSGAAARVRQLGEDERNVHCVGSTGLDLIRTTPRMSRDIFYSSIGLQPRSKNLLVTLHPATLEGGSEMHCAELLAALDGLGPDFGLIFTGSNLDPGGCGIDAMISKFVASRPHSVSFASLGAKRYFSALEHADVVIGNSSSGLYEAPSFQTPTVNIGSRQQGRLKAQSVIDCAPERGAIQAAVGAALATDCSAVINPYGDGHATPRIISILKRLDDPRALLRKTFKDVEV